MSIKPPADNPSLFSFRPATPTDASAISSLVGSTWSHFFAYSVTPSDLAHYLSTSLSPTQISLDIQNPDISFILAFTPGPSPGQSEILAGVIQLNRKTSEPSLTLTNPIEIRRLYIQPTLQGSGLAKILMATADTLAREEGYDGTWLGVWEDNERAKRFYTKCGYVRRGTKEFMVGGKVRVDWVMERALPSV